MNTESCLFGTFACTRRPTAVVTACYTPGTTAGESRPMCSEHVLVLVEAITEHGDGFTVTVAPLPRTGDTMST